MDVFLDTGDRSKEESSPFLLSIALCCVSKTCVQKAWEKAGTLPIGNWEAAEADDGEFPWTVYSNSQFRRRKGEKSKFSIGYNRDKASLDIF